MKRLQAFLALLPAFLAVSLSSCDRPECKNTQPIFEHYAPGSKAYRNELARQMQKIPSGKLRYWFDEAFRERGKEFYQLHVQGDELCATMIVENRTPDHSLGKGGYHGAELKGVAITIVQDTAGPAFVLERIDRVAD